MNIGETKTEKGTRTIVLPESTLAILSKRKKAAHGDWIFPYPTRPEKPMNPSHAYNHLKYLMKKNGLPNIRFHDLRHRYFSCHTADFAVQLTQKNNIHDRSGIIFADNIPRVFKIVHGYQPFDLKIESPQNQKRV